MGGWSHPDKLQRRGDREDEGIWAKQKRPSAGNTKRARRINIYPLIRGGNMFSKDQSNKKITEYEATQRIKRLERVCLVLCISFLLLALFSIKLAGTTWDIVGVFDFLTEQINLIGEKVDAIRNSLQGI